MMKMPEGRAAYRARWWILLFIGLYAGLIFSLGSPTAVAAVPKARYVILMVADGWGANHIDAANSYAGVAPVYQEAPWGACWMSTYPIGGAYDPALAWSDFDYVRQGATDSAAAATALYTGVKVAGGRITVTADGSARLQAITEKTRATGMAAGAVTSVQIGHATPGAWMAHNLQRTNGYAITDEGLWGDPNTTGAPADSAQYGGHFGPTLPPLDVVIGGGHPAWNDSYVNNAMRDKLAAESGTPGAFTFVERLSGSPDGGARLLFAADDPSVIRLVGLFGGSRGQIEYRLADGTGHNPENPTLAQMTQAALTVLARDPNGFVLMIEGGAIDWAAHANLMNEMVGELLAFNAAVQSVVDWVEAENNGSNWSNTLVIVTGDHETGYLTAAPGLFPDQALGPVNADTLALEKVVAVNGRRASWEDGDANGAIDAGETVYWAWNSGDHTNSLIPLYARGVGAGLCAEFATGVDPVRGAYLDLTDVFRVMDAVTAPPLDLHIERAEDALLLQWVDDESHLGYAVHRSTAPYFTASGANQIATPETAHYTDDGGPDLDIIGDVNTNYFYLVIATNDPLGVLTSKYVGEFDFALVPGAN